MAFLTGIVLIDAPASALNNGQGEDTRGKVKSIYVRGQGHYPYISAQSFRFWLRETMQRVAPELPPSPVYSAGTGQRQQAFTVGDPITYWDDDLLGYMRAEKSETVTRVSPFRTSTVVSIAPVQLVDDFGVMARLPEESGGREGVLLHGHEFYRTTLQLLFSLDLARVGTFTDKRRTGYKNLGTATLKLAEEKAMAYDETLDAYRMDQATRIQRVQFLLRALGRLEGGAKQTLHYTDVSPAFLMAAVTPGGNHIFGRVIRTGSDSKPAIHEGALQQVRAVFGTSLLSPIYAGCVAGFMDESAAILEREKITVAHPQECLDQLANELAAHPEWLD